MSALNLWLSDSRALLGVDTRAVPLLGGEQHRASKVVALPHANILLAGRGTGLGLSCAFSMAQQHPRIDDYDSAIEAFPELLVETFSHIKDGMAALVPDPRVLQAQELMVVGWSAQRARVAAVMFQQLCSDTGFAVTEIDSPGYVSPWLPTWGGDPPVPNTNERHQELLTDQLRRSWLELGPQAAIGGELVVAELTRDGIGFKVLRIKAPVRRRLLSELVITG